MTSVAESCDTTCGADPCDEAWVLFSGLFLQGLLVHSFIIRSLLVSLVFPYHTPANRAQKKIQLRRVYLCTRHPRTDGKGALAGQPHLPRRARQKRRGVAW